MNGSADEVKNPRDAGASRALLKTLSTYKEIITIIVFFIAGFIWLETNLAKKDQINSLNCILNNRLTILESQLTIKISEIVLNLLKTERLKIGIALDDVEPERSRSGNIRYTHINEEISALEADIENAEARYRESNRTIIEQQCTGI